MTETKKPSMRVHHIIRQIAVRQGGDNVGCWDGSCIYGHPGGMQTNGGCECLKERNPQRLILHILQLRQICQTLAAMVPWVEEPVETSTEQDADTYHDGHDDGFNAGLKAAAAYVRTWSRDRLMTAAGSDLADEIVKIEPKAKRKKAQ